MNKRNCHKGSRLLRKGRFSKSGCYYFITTSTYKKIKIFTKVEYFKIILKSLKFLEKENLVIVKQQQNILHIWQDQYYDHLIRKNKGYKEIMKYCWYNPVRKGLVNKPNEYPFWWSKYELS